MLPLVLFSLISQFLNAQGSGDDGQLSFNWNASEPTIITSESLDTAKCSIAFDTIESDSSYYITYSEFDEIHEQRFENRIFVAKVRTDLSLAPIANASHYNASDIYHLPLYLIGTSGTFNPMVAIGTNSSVFAFDMNRNTSTDDITTEINDLTSKNLQEIYSGDGSNEFTQPQIKYAGTANDKDYYILLLRFNSSSGNDLVIYELEGTNNIIEGDCCIYGDSSLTISNPKLGQSNTTSQVWLLAYDVTDATSSDVYGSAIYWDRPASSAMVTTLESPLQLTNIDIDHTNVILQDIASADNICASETYNISFLIVFTVDNQIAIDLIGFYKEEEALNLVRRWDTSYIASEIGGNDYVHVGQSNTDFVKIMHIQDLNVSNHTTDTDYYIISYIDEDQNAVLRAFAISGCNEPTFGWIGGGTSILESTSAQNDYTGSKNHSSLCMAEDTITGDIAMGWFEYHGEEEIAIEGEDEYRVHEYVLFTGTFSYGWETRTPTTSPITYAPTLTTDAPTDVPTNAPTDEPTTDPTDGPTDAPTDEPTKNPTFEPTPGPTSSPGLKSTSNPEHVAGVASASFEALGDSPLKSPILIVIVFLIVMCVVITILAWLHNFRSSWFPCFWYTDDARVGTLIIYAVQVWDFASDCNFTYCLWVVWFANRHITDYEYIHQLFFISAFFLITPWALNLIWIVVQRWRWSRHSLVNAWVRDYAWLLVGLCMVSGGANPTVQLCNSRIFALQPFSMELPRYDYLKSSRWPIFFVTMFENIPQIVVQFAFVIAYSDITMNCQNFESDHTEFVACKGVLQATAFASISSIVSVVFAFGVCLLQLSDPLDDKRFVLDLKLDDNEDEDKVRLQLGMRKKIGRAIANAIDMSDSVVTVESCRWGYNKLKFVIAVTESQRELEKQIKNKEDANEQHYDNLLHQILTAKANGQLAGCMKKVLKLEYMPVIENIEIPDADDMPDMNDVVQKIKNIGPDADQIVIAVNNSARQMKPSYDDAVKVHQQSNVNSDKVKPLIMPHGVDGYNNINDVSPASMQNKHSIELQDYSNYSGSRGSKSASAINSDAGSHPSEKRLLITLNDDGPLLTIPRVQSTNIEGNAIGPIEEGNEHTPGLEIIDDEKDDIDDVDQMQVQAYNEIVSDSDINAHMNVNEVEDVNVLAYGDDMDVDQVDVKGNARKETKTMGDGNDDDYSDDDDVDNVNLDDDKNKKRKETAEDLLQGAETHEFIE